MPIDFPEKCRQMATVLLKMTWNKKSKQAVYLRLSHMMGSYLHYHPPPPLSLKVITTIMWSILGLKGLREYIYIYIYTRKVPVLRTVTTKFLFTSNLKISGHPDILAATHLGLPNLWINNSRGLVNIYAIDR